MTARKVIVLTDPGQDQAAAILMMLGRPDAFEVLGLVATAGNIGLDYTINNCLKLLELCGRPDIPVYAGSAQPMHRELVMAEHVHGPTGLDGANLPAPTTIVQDGTGAQFIVDTLQRHEPDEITIVGLSPLTNLALAFQLAPDVVPRVKEIIAMLGAYFEVGNITPTAEFNCFVDPEAADIILRSGCQITLLPLDVTHQMRSTPGRLAALRALGNKSGISLAGMLEFSETFDLKKYGWNGAPLHGPCVPSFILAPHMFTGKQINVSVELAGSLTTGMTVADWWQITDREPNVYWVRDGDPSTFYQMLTSAVENLP